MSSYPGNNGGFKADRNDRGGFSCSLIANSCCFCSSLQTGTSFIGLIGILASIVLIALQLINGTFVSIILVACAVIILSGLIIAGAVLERPVLLIAYIVVVGVALLLFCGYFIYYIYSLTVSTIPIAAYIPILVFLFLVVSLYSWYVVLCYFYELTRLSPQRQRFPSSSDEQKV